MALKKSRLGSLGNWRTLSGTRRGGVCWKAEARWKRDPFGPPLKQGLTLDDGQHRMRPVQGDGQAQGPQELPLVQQVSQLLLSGRQEARQGGANGSR